MHKLTIFLVVVACSWYGQAVMEDPNVTPSSSLVPPKLGKYDFALLLFSVCERDDSPDWRWVAVDDIQQYYVITCIY